LPTPKPNIRSAQPVIAKEAEPTAAIHDYPLLTLPMFVDYHTRPASGTGSQ